MTARKHHRVSLTIISQHDGQQVAIGAMEVPSICAVTSPPVTDEVRGLMDVHGLLAADAARALADMDQQISLLIGSDYYWKVTSENISRLTPRLTAVETIFGWTLQGAPSDEGACRLRLSRASHDDVTEDEELSSLWRLDAIGIKERPDVSGLDMAAVEQFEGQVRKDGARYEVPLMIQEPGLDARADNFNDIFCGSSAFLQQRSPSLQLSSDE